MTQEVNNLPLNSAEFAGHWPQYVKQIYHGGDMSAALNWAEQMELDLNAELPDSGRH